MDNFLRSELANEVQELRRWALGRRDIEKLNAFARGDNCSERTDEQVRLAIMGLLEFSTWAVTQLGREVLETAPPDLQIGLIERSSNH